MLPLFILEIGRKKWGITVQQYGISVPSKRLLHFTGDIVSRKVLLCTDLWWTVTLFQQTLISDLFTYKYINVLFLGLVCGTVFDFEMFIIILSPLWLLKR